VDQLRAVVALAGRANALAGGCLADASDAGPGQLGLALALLGATADTLDVAGQRGAVDRVLACLEGREAIAESLSHNSAVTVPEACREIADVLVQEVAQSDDFHSVTNPLLSLWDVAPLAVSPAPARWLCERRVREGVVGSAARVERGVLQ
jgi:hypothetical protein